MLFMVAFVFLLFGASATSTVSTICNWKEGTVLQEEVCMDQSCMKAIENQIIKELEASFFYLTMGIYYSTDVISRPGMARFMFEGGTEERNHAIQMLNYLSLRGRSPHLGKIEEKRFTIGEYKEQTIIESLKNTLEEEVKVTDAILKVVEKCSNHSDFHGADVFTNPILDEQYNGMRKLQGAIRTYKNLLENSNPHVTNYLFDHKIINGEIL